MQYKSILPFLRGGVGRGVCVSLRTACCCQKYHNFESKKLKLSTVVILNHGVVRYCQGYPQFITYLVANFRGHIVEIILNKL